MSRYLDVCERVCLCLDKERRLYSEWEYLSCGYLDNRIRDAEWEDALRDAYFIYLAASHATQEALEAYREYNKP
jgi:hypothetical protein